MLNPKLGKTVLALLVAAAMITIGPRTAKAEVTTNIKVPVSLVRFVPCADGGSGELVFLEGEIHVLIAVTENSAGGFHVEMHRQPQGVKGIGLTTGVAYQANGVTRETFNVNAGVEDTFVNNFRIIGQGPGNNFMVHENFHITVNANGEVEAFVDNFSVDCN